MINHETVIMESKRFPFEEYGGDINITEMRIQTQKFVASKKRARPIALKNLNRYKTAWFEHGHPNESTVIECDHRVGDFRENAGRGEGLET